MAQIKNTTIYVSDIYGTSKLPERSFPSMIQAIDYIYSRPDLGSKDLLLCCGAYSLDYVQPYELKSQYYKRMRKLFHEIAD